MSGPIPLPGDLKPGADWVGERFLARRVKRRDLLAHLEAHGSHLVREGAPESRFPPRRVSGGQGNVLLTRSRGGPSSPPRSVPAFEGRFPRRADVLRP